ncbi:MAG TPA: hypothetical protein VG733_08660 [Chthoniobacteraceae bacterium]|nr:hypothetical protein [Chthoniobacteraceae bacterium]
MKFSGAPSRVCQRICLPMIAVAAAFCLQPAAMAASATLEKAVQSKLDGATILNAPAPKLVAAVRETVKENPQMEGAVVSLVLSSGRADADAISPKVSAAAIEGLGPNPSQVAVTNIVVASVKATPAVVLEIVRASVKAAPSCAKAIVKAAVMAVPDPKQKIPPIAAGPANAADTQGYTKDDSKDMPRVDAATNNPDNLLPIAEAIAQAASQGLGDPSDPGAISIPYQELLAAANDASVQRATGSFTVTSVYSGYYYPPLISVRKTAVPAALPGTPVVSK